MDLFFLLCDEIFYVINCVNIIKNCFLLCNESCYVINNCKWNIK